MSHHLTRALFVDLEFTCWEGEPPAGEAPEIIEIGVVEIHTETGAPGRVERRLCRPRTSRVSPFCTRLTGITPDELRRYGRPFPEVCRTLRKMFGAKPWYSWGNDREAVLRDCALTGADNPFPGPFVDLSLVWRQLMGETRKVGLSDALAAMGGGFDGTPHRALEDARNTAELFRMMARRFAAPA